MARQLTGKWTNGKAANRWENQFLIQNVEDGVHRTSLPMARRLTGKWTNSKAANRLERKILTLDAEDHPTK